MLKKELKREMRDMSKIITTSKSDNKAEKARKTLGEITSVYNELYKDKHDFSDARKMKLGNIDIDSHFENFIIALITICSQIELGNPFNHLITIDPDDYIEYLYVTSSRYQPLVNETSALTNEQVLEHCNTIFNGEGFDRNILTRGTVRVSTPSLFSKLTLSNGNCIVYHNYLSNRSRMRLERYNDIRDLVLPCRESILTFKPFFNQYDNFINILRYYMEAKATLKLARTQYDRSAKLYYEGIMEDIVKMSYAYFSHIEKGNKPNNLQRAEIIDLADRIIGYSLAKDEKQSLRRFLENPFVTGTNSPNLSIVNSSYDQVLDSLKQDIKVLQK